MRARDHTPGAVPLVLEAAMTLLLGCPPARDSRRFGLSSPISKTKAPVP